MCFNGEKGHESERPLGGIAARFLTAEEEDESGHGAHAQRLRRRPVGVHVHLVEGHLARKLLSKGPVVRRDLPTRAAALAEEVDDEREPGVILVKLQRLLKLPVLAGAEEGGGAERERGGMFIRKHQRERPLKKYLLNPNLPDVITVLSSVISPRVNARFEAPASAAPGPAPGLTPGLLADGRTMGLTTLCQTEKKSAHGPHSERERERALNNFERFQK